MSRRTRQDVGRYDRQLIYEQLGPSGQRALARGRALLVGVGGLGCAVADLLARAGVGFLRLVDDDAVRLENLHRQVLFDEGDVAAGRPKVVAAAGRLRRVNGEVQVEAVAQRFGPDNAAELAAGVDVILDGTDNFATRFVINDLAVRDGIGWVFAGAVGAEAQTMTILPPRTPCLRCVFDAPPPPCLDPTCRAAGVLAPAVVAIAAVEAAEAIKILAGRTDSISPHLLKLDLWTCTVQRINLAEACAGVDCPCCRRRQFDFLEPAT